MPSVACKQTKKLPNGASLVCMEFRILMVFKIFDLRGCLSTQSPLAMPLHVIYSSTLTGPTHAMDAREEPNPTLVFHICFVAFPVHTLMILYILIFEVGEEKSLVNLAYTTSMLCLKEAYKLLQ